MCLMFCVESHQDAMGLFCFIIFCVFLTCFRDFKFVYVFYDVCVVCDTFVIFCVFLYSLRKIMII